MSANKKGSVYRQWIVSATANITIFSYGLQSGWMSPAIPILQSDRSPSGYPLSSLGISWIASTLCITAVMSSMVYSYIADRFGRRIALIAVAIPQALGFIIKLISAHPISLIVAQGFCGIAGGGVFCIVPLYTKEVSQDSLRGVLGTVAMLLQSTGLLVMYAMGSYLDFFTVLWIVMWIPIINIIVLLIIPESPAYLVKKGKIEEATSIMAYLRGVDTDNKGVQNDISLTRNEVANFERCKSISIETILSNKPSRIALALSCLLLTMTDMGGNFAIFTYASVVIRDSGITIQPRLQALSLPTIMILGSLLTIVMIERSGRKPIMITSLVFTGVPMAILASILLIQHHGGIVHWTLPMGCIVLCVFSYGAVLPVPFIVISEIFNVQFRAKVLGYLVTYGWFLCFLQIVAFPPVSEYLGMYTMFYAFSAVNICSAILCYILMPETKGKCLEQIEKELQGVKN